MARADSLSDQQIDELLERFDQTEPALQRRIIAEFALLADERLELARQVQTMRRLQRAYFKTRTGRALEAACDQERRVDQLADAILGLQPGLFDEVLP